MDYPERQRQLIEEMVREFAKGGYSDSTVVGIRERYEDDDAICLTSVVFPDGDLIEAISEKIIEPLRQIEPNHYYYQPGSLHLTIKNVRTIHNPPLFTAEDAEKARKVFSRIIATFTPFFFELSGIVSFPTSVSLLGYSDEMLHDLVTSLDRGLNEIGIPDNKKYFSDCVFFGNITICRFTSLPSEQFLAGVDELRDVQIGKLGVEKISLISCNAVCSPASRKVVDTFHLTG